MPYNWFVTISINGFGITVLSSVIRDPNPPARITAFIQLTIINFNYTVKVFQYIIFMCCKY